MIRRLFAVLLVAALPVGGGFAVAAEESDDPPAYERVVDITFPVSGEVHYTDTYHADRGGGSRKHQATDIMGEYGLPVHAAMGGEITWITGIDSAVPSYGYMIRIAGDDGLSYSYVHLGRQDGVAGDAYASGMADGVRVERGEWIGYLGCSGNASCSAPHLHFEIFDPELDDPALEQEPYTQGRLNPYGSLLDAQERQDYPTPPDWFEDGTPPPSEQPPPGSSGQEDEQGATPAYLRRVSGTTRVTTAVALSQAISSARTVVVVPAGSFAEALLAAPLAAHVNAPVLLSGPDGLDREVADEVRRLGATNAYVVGRPEQLAPSTEADLTAAGVQNLARLAADDRYELSALVARELLSYPDVDGFDRVLLARGEAPVESQAWPDALSASAFAAHLEVPVLLTRSDRLPADIAEVLSELAPDVVQVVGGTAAVTDAVAEDAAAAAGGASVARLAGPTRYGTSVAVVEAAVAAGASPEAVWLATGRDFPDALAAGPAAERAGAALLLVDGAQLDGSPESQAWLRERAEGLGEVVLVGGTAAISEAVAEAVQALLAS